jgi:TRAP-type C4-dicarboxylate transport system permease small subunit
MARLRNSAPIDLPMAGDVHGRVRCFNEKVVLASQPAGDTIEVARLPRGARLLYGLLSATVSLGASALAAGISGQPAKYRAAQAFTAIDTPTLFGMAAGTGEPLGAEEIVLLSISGAALPATGTLRVMLFYMLD